MRSNEYVRSWVRHRGELIPVGYSWSFVVGIDVAMVAVLIWSTLQRTQADLLMAAVAALVGVAPLVLFYVSGIKYSPGLVWMTSLTATAILLFATSTPIATDFAPLCCWWRLLRRTGSTGSRCI
jgi:hypothetical protein